MQSRFSGISGAANFKTEDSFIYNKDKIICTLTATATGNTDINNSRQVNFVVSGNTKYVIINFSYTNISIYFIYNRTKLKINYRNL